MSKKEQLLTEGQVRQFMKLANLEPLSPGFIHGLSEKQKDWGMGKREKSRTRPGEEDYTTKKGKKKKTSGRGRGEKKGDEAYVNEADYDYVDESHGRGRGEGAAGYGSPDDGGRAGARLREDEIAEQTLNYPNEPGTLPPKQSKVKLPRVDDEDELDEDQLPPGHVGGGGPNRKEDRKKRRRDEQAPDKLPPVKIDPPKDSLPAWNAPIVKSPPRKKTVPVMRKEAADLPGSTTTLPTQSGGTGPSYRDDEDEWENAENDLEHAEDLEVDAEEDLGDMGDEAPLGDGREVSVDDFLAALEVALEDVLGDEVEVDQEGEVEDEELVDLDNGEELEVGLDVEEEPALQEMISTITRRVAKRIVKEALQNKQPRRRQRRRRRRR